CESGDINLQPTTIDNSTGSGGTAARENPCARYEEAGQTYQGQLRADGHCYYDSTFVSATRPIRVSAITFRRFGGFHVFEDSLYIGEDVNAIDAARSEEHTSELQSRENLVCRPLLEKKTTDPLVLDGF